MILLCPGFGGMDIKLIVVEDDKVYIAPTYAFLHFLHLYTNALILLVVSYISSLLLEKCVSHVFGNDIKLCCELMV